MFYMNVLLAQAHEFSHIQQEYRITMTMYLRYLMSLSLFLLLTACVSQQDDSVDSHLANAVVFSAMNQVGASYRYGGNSPATGFDCSGLVNYVYKKNAGISLPRSVKEIRALSVPEPSRDALQSGDVVIFATGHSRKPDHAGIYVGKNRFVHAPSSGGKVRLDKLEDAYWNKHYLTAKRPLAR